MMFSSPIPRAVQPRFNEGANVHGVSVRDSRNNSKSWQKNNVVKNQSSSDGGVLANLQRQVAQLRKRQIGYQLSEPLQVLPFTIYPQKQFINPTHDQFNDLLTFQIRGGLVGVRSSFSTLTSADMNNWWDLSSSGKTAGNYETQIYCDGTDPSSNNAFSAFPIGVNFNFPQTQNKNGNINIAYGAKTEIKSSIFAATGTQIILNIRSDFTYLQAAAFWIEIVNNAGELSAKMYGQLFDDVTYYPFPDPDNLPVGVSEVIPLGMIIPAIGYPALFVPTFLQRGLPIFIPVNFYSEDIVNRYAPTNSTNFSTSPLNYRGAWDADNLSGQSFYPSDLILDDTQTDSSDTGLSTGSLSLTWNNYFICKKYQDTQSDVPTDDGINWQKFSQTNLSLSYTPP